MRPNPAEHGGPRPLAATPSPASATAPRRPRVLVVGAGVGGLTAAALLARDGLDVQVLEQAAEPGGKLRQVMPGDRPMDAGPTVLTMRWVFDELFDALGQSFEARVGLRRCEVLARHAWGPDRLDLLADLPASVDAIARLCGPREAAGYQAFCRRAQAIFQTLDAPFLRDSRPHPLSLAWRVGWRQLPALWSISPFRSLWDELGRYFADPRLRQLFGRYATYCGSSPFHAPATLMLVAHVEREAVWLLEGGMQSLAQALAAAARAQGVRLRCGQPVRELRLAQGRVCGLTLASGETLEAEAVLFNGDTAALHQGLLGPAVQAALGRHAGARAAAQLPRSLSALTWHLEAQTEGFALSHHNVFFSGPQDGAYRREFDALAAGRLPDDPTVYVCAQDRHAGRRGSHPTHGPERLMCLVNAPALPAGATTQALRAEELERCETRMWQQLRRAGLRLTTPDTPSPAPATLLRTRPEDFARMFPGSGGALYGPATQGWRSSFQRPATRSPVPGLFLAGGTVHPGPGVPMAALSGRLAARQLLADLASTRRWHPVAMPGGTPMR